MSEKYDLADYLVNLISIMDSKESTGIAKGNTLIKEYDRAYAEFKGILQKEQANETRKG